LFAPCAVMTNENFIDKRDTFMYNLHVDKYCAKNVSSINLMVSRAKRVGW
jgi:hypothetical protein